MPADESPIRRVTPFDATQAISSTRQAPTQIGSYRLLQRLGEGGMGEVWLAQQTEPVQRQVAIKVIKAGMDSARVVARFEAERQALAMMDHPAIAKVFEAGATAEGRPYFAMEYVRGESITAYCDRQRLGVRDRLELFTQLCDGVQHAHQKGIIHRDLKPSNVLVGLTDDRPVPHIIDFGIAKAVAQPLSDHSLFTEFGALIGTPEYMSPEQAELTPLDVDTRSDVYSLGLLLYELLVGSLPFDREALRQAGLDELRRTIREKDAPRPSTQLARRPAEAGGIAASRGTQPNRLVGVIPGDLDWITIKALEKDRTRRYATANALAMDIRRHLADEPVLAGPPSAAYRTTKFVKRHRLGVAAATLLILLLAAFATVMTMQARRIARERDRANQEAATARQVSDFLVGLFRVSDPTEARGNALTAREVIAKGARQLDSNLLDQPQVRARLQATIGSVYTALGLYAEAEPMLEQALGAIKRTAGDDSPEALQIANDLANVYWYEERFRDAEPLYVEIVARRTRLLGVDHPDTLRANFDLASAYLEQQRYDAYEALSRDTLARQRRVQGNDHPDTLSSLNNLQAFYYRLGRYREAETIAREVFETRRRVLPADHPDIMRAMHNLASTLDGLGRDDEAESMFRQAIDGKRRVLGGEHPQTCQSLAQLGRLYMKRKRYPDAERVLLEAYEGFSKALGLKHRDTKLTAQKIVSLYEAQGQATKAADWRAKLSAAQ